jgi:hypothetical protein
MSSPARHTELTSPHGAARAHQSSQRTSEAARLRLIHGNDRTNPQIPRPDREPAAPATERLSQPAAEPDLRPAGAGSPDPGGRLTGLSPEGKIGMEEAPGRSAPDLAAVTAQPAARRPRSRRLRPPGLAIPGHDRSDRAPDRSRPPGSRPPRGGAGGLNDPAELPAHSRHGLAGGRSGAQAGRPSRPSAWPTGVLTSCGSQRRCSCSRPARISRGAVQAAISGADLTPRNAAHRAASHRFSVRITYLTCVDLWGFEPRTSCMPSAGRTSTGVHSRRSPSLWISRGAPESGHVAVLSCCTQRQVHRSSGTSRYFTMAHTEGFPSPHEVSRLLA